MQVSGSWPSGEPPLGDIPANSLHPTEPMIESASQDCPISINPEHRFFDALSSKALADPQHLSLLETHRKQQEITGKKGNLETDNHSINIKRCALKWRTICFSQGVLMASAQTYAIWSGLFSHSRCLLREDLMSFFGYSSDFSVLAGNRILTSPRLMILQRFWWARHHTINFIRGSGPS